MKFVDNIKSTLKNLRNRLPAVMAVAIMGTSAVSCSSGEKNKTEDKKTDKIEQIVKIKKPVKNIKYVTDTLFQSKGRALLYNRGGLITRNYVDKNSMYKLDLPSFSHEDWHSHNNEVNFRLTPFEYYKSRIHNEISANIAALLTARYQYMVAKDKKMFIKKQKGGIFGFYFDEIAKGKIKPENTNPEALEKEYDFIANRMKEYWMKKSYKWYMPSFYYMLQQYIRRNVQIYKSNKSYYGNTLRHMYTIGGVDFSKYLHQDIELSDGRIAIADGLRNVNSMRDGGLEIMDYVNNGYTLFDNIGAEKQTEAFQHLLIAAKLKYALSDMTAEELQENPQLIDMYYRQTISKFQKDKTFEEYVENFPAFNEKSCAIRTTNARKYREIIDEIYTFRGVNLRKSIKDFKIAQVPVKTPNFKELNFTDNVYQWSPTMEFQNEMPVNRYVGPIIMAENNQAEKLNYKRRLSNWQYIAAPNYREPILTSASKEDKKQILVAIAEFDNIPEVLKECDTEAQKRYYDALEKEQDGKNIKSTQIKLQVQNSQKSR